MTSTQPTPDVDGRAASRRGGIGDLTGGRLEIGALIAFVLLRAAVVLTADRPAITPDESGTWAIARYLTGGDPLIFMRDMPKYPLVAGMAVAPWSLLPGDPVLRYRLALLALSALTVVAAWLVRSTLRELAIGGPLVPAVGFVAVLLFPATFATGSFTWAEPTIVLCLVAVMWSVVRLVHRPAVAPLVVGAVAAGLAPATHGRLVAVPVVWVLLLVWMVVRRHDPRIGVAHGAAAATVTVGVALACRALGSAVVDTLWDDPSTVARFEPGTSVLDPDLWAMFGAVLAGQVWYLLVSTGGLALVGAAVLAHRCLRPRDAADRITAVAVGALLSSVVAVSVLTTAVAHHAGDTSRASIFALRPDHLVYGRYNDVVGLVLAVIGVAGLSTIRGRRAAVPLLAAAAGAMFVCALPPWLRMPDTVADTMDLTIAGTAVLVRSDGALPLLGQSLLGALVALVVALACRRGPRVLALTVCVLMLAGSVRAADVAGDMHRGSQVDRLAERIGTPSDGSDGAVVAADAERDGAMRLNVFPLQAALAPTGWRFSFPDQSSAAVAAAPGRDTSLLVLLDSAGEPAGSWRLAAAIGDVAIWRRT